ncbi:MAG: hypothetical protein KDK62_01400 [Chlamydiia bacterium]|nr:hypothetical protein [Chlamydiia bacterium]
MSTEKNKATGKQLDQLIERAAKKVGARKENDICRYIPGTKGGYIHHFSMRKMKHENPEELASLLNNYILNVDNPKQQKPSPRAPRGSRKKKDHLPLTKQDIDLLLGLARKSGAKEIVRKLAPRRDLKSVKRDLLSSIKHGRVEEDLWHSYTEIVMSQAQPV